MSPWRVGVDNNRHERRQCRCHRIVQLTDVRALAVVETHSLATMPEEAVMQFRMTKLPDIKAAASVSQMRA